MESRHRLHANTVPFYIRDLSIQGFWDLLESWDQGMTILVILYFKKLKDKINPYLSFMFML
jgi:hypothetical protein